MAVVLREPMAAVRELLARMGIPVLSVAVTVAEVAEVAVPGSAGQVVTVAPLVAVAVLAAQAVVEAMMVLPVVQGQQAR